MLIERCPECGSWEVECSSDKPVPGCGCARCLRAELKQLRAKIKVESEAHWQTLCLGQRVGKYLDKLPGEAIDEAAERVVKERNELCAEVKRLREALTQRERGIEITGVKQLVVDGYFCGIDRPTIVKKEEE